MSEEFIEALNGFVHVPFVPPTNKAYYDKKGKILEVTTEERDGDFIVLEDEWASVSVSPDWYRIIDRQLFRADVCDLIVLQFEKDDNGDYRTIKDDMLFLDKDSGEDGYINN